MEKLEEIKQKQLDWVERLDVTVPVKRSEEFEETGGDRSRLCLKLVNVKCSSFKHNKTVRNIIFEI